MGYLILSEFTAIEVIKAFWLTRLPLTTGVSLTNGRALEKLLRSRKKTILDLEVLAGEGKKKCRLVAVRATDEITKKRRFQRRKKAKERGKIPCPKGLVRDGWHLMLTNLTEEQASVTQLAAIYRARWAIEIQFRARKQSLNLGKALNRKTNKHHMEAIVMAGMIARQLGMKLGGHLSEQLGSFRLSFEKLYDQLASYLVKARSLQSLREFSPDPRHISRDKRLRETPIKSGILALT